MTLLQIYIVSVQFSSVAQSCLTLCNPMNCSTPGLPVQHRLPELTQTHVHWLSDAIQPSYPQSSPSPALNLSKHQGLFKWVSSLHQSIGVSVSTSDPPKNTQDWFPLGWTGWISLQSKGLSSLLQHHSSKASILWRSTFFIVQLSHPYMTTGGKKFFLTLCFWPQLYISYFYIQWTIFSEYDWWLYFPYQDV